MAMTATIAVSPSTAKINQDIKATLTVSNSAGVAVNVTRIQPFIRQTNSNADDNASSSVSLPAMSGTSGPPISVSVAASGSTVFVFYVRAFAPSTNSSTYDVGAVCYSDDGSVFSPTAATVTVQSL